MNSSQEAMIDFLFIIVGALVLFMPYLFPMDKKTRTITNRSITYWDENPVWCIVTAIAVYLVYGIALYLYLGATK